MSFNEKQYKKNMYLKIKSLYINKKYKNLLKETTLYLNDFPDDMNVRFMRAKAYRYLGMFDECLNDLEYNNRLGYDLHTITELFFVYYYLYRFDEALKILQILYSKNTIKNHSLKIAELVIKKELNMKVEFGQGSRSDYIKNQIINYDKRKAISHISEHIENKKFNEDDYSVSYFKENINIEYLYDIITNNINNNKKLNSEEIMEIYFFSIFNVGYLKGNNCNYIKVVVVPKTKNIITMYPTDNVEDGYVNELEYDYNKLFIKTEKENIKQLSMIEKFNRRSRNK